MLITLKIPPSAPINEDQLSSALKIGRTPLREALKQLEIERLVAIYPRRGTFATDINIESLGTLTELRCVLEGLSAQLAARRRNDDDISRLIDLRDSLDAMAIEQAQDEQYFEIHRTIHDEIYRIARNPYLAATAIAHYQLSSRMWHVFNGRTRPLSSHRAMYHDLLTSLVEGDATNAKKIAEEHVADFRDEVKTLL